MIINTLLEKLAKLLGKTIQDPPRIPNADESAAGGELSVSLSACRAVSVRATWGCNWQVAGSGSLATYLSEFTSSFVEEQLDEAIESALASGDSLLLPVATEDGVVVQTIPSNRYAIVSAAGRKATEILLVVDSCKVGSTEYTLLEDIEFDRNERTQRSRLFVVRGGGSPSTDLSQVEKWAAYQQESTITGVERMLVGRIRCPVTNPLSPNSCKGAPLCSRAGEPIKAYKELLSSQAYEFKASEKMVFASKNLFTMGPSPLGGPSQPQLPKGKERLYQALNIDDSQSDPIKEWAPDIRAAEYDLGIESAARVVELAVGLDRGIITRANDSTYQNVDNVRKSQILTNSLIASVRRAAQAGLDDMLYAVSVLAVLYEKVPYGEYSATMKWSNELIETQDSKRQQLLDGITVAAIEPAEYRQWVTGEDIEQARKACEEIEKTRNGGV